MRLFAVKPIDTVSPRTPPTFLWHTFEDAVVPVSSSLEYLLRLVENGVPCEAHVYQRGRHGMALGTRASAKSPAEIDDQVASWGRLVGEWLWRGSTMRTWTADTLGIGGGLWLLGYLVSLALFFTPLTVGVAWWRFRGRDLPLRYYAGVGLAWAAIAVVLDYLAIVRLFDAGYCAPDVFVYDALTFLIPVGVGLYLKRARGKTAYTY